MRSIFLLLFSASLFNETLASPVQRDTAVQPVHYNPNFSAPANAPYIAEEVIITAKGGHKLAGTLTIPKHVSTPLMTIVTITGSGPQDRDHNTTDGAGRYRIFAQLADTLGRRGIAVLRMDDRGVGQSTGDFWSATTQDRADDIREAIAYIQTRKDMASSRIGLVGLSEGAMIAPLIASTDNTLAGIILMAGPVSKGKDIIAGQISYRINLDSTLSTKKSDSAFQAQQEEYLHMMNENPWLKYFWEYDPAQTAAKVDKVPVLILQGTSDRNVPWREAEKLAEIFRGSGNKDVTIKILPDINHIFLNDPDGNPAKYGSLPTFDVSKEVLGLIVDWLLKISFGKNR